VSLFAEDAERLIRLVAHRVGAVVYAGAQRLLTGLSKTGERFEPLAARCRGADLCSSQAVVVGFTLDSCVASSHVFATTPGPPCPGPAI
jgi:type IV secretion system protein VirB11